MRVYLGAAIDTSKSDPAINFTSMTRALENYVATNFAVYNPNQAFSVYNNESVEGANFVVKVNTEALLASDLAFFVVDDNPSFGVPVEIWMAAERRIETIVWWKASKKPGLYLQSLVNNRFHICESDADLIDIFATIKSQETPTLRSKKVELKLTIPKEVVKQRGSRPGAGEGLEE
jgi:hypothetical protein